MKMGNASLEWVHVYKYLGMEIHSDGNFTLSSENLCTRGWKATFKIKSAFKDVDVNPALRLKLFDVLVKPIVCYGSEIWGLMNNLFNSKSTSQFWERASVLPVEKFQVKYCRGLLGVNCKAINVAVMGEVGRFPLIMSIINGALKFFKHLEEVKLDRPMIKAAIKEDGALCVSKSWKGRLDKILSLFNCPPLDSLSVHKCIGFMQNALRTEYLKYWESMLGDRESEEGKLYLYRKLKTSFRMEPYLQHIKQFKYRKAMTMFRISAHRLEIETGRWLRNDRTNKSVPRDDRVCSLCFENNILTLGDEEHAMLSCPNFAVDRNKVLLYLDRNYPNFSSLNGFDKMFFMLTCEEDSAFITSRFLLKIISSQRPNFEKTWKKIRDMMFNS